MYLFLLDELSKYTVHRVSFNKLVMFYEYHLVLRDEWQLPLVLIVSSKFNSGPLNKKSKQILSFMLISSIAILQTSANTFGQF